MRDLQPCVESLRLRFPGETARSVGLFGRNDVRLAHVNNPIVLCADPHT